MPASTSQPLKVDGDAKKNKKKSKSSKEGDDFGLKRPLSAYMLYNNYRRPLIKTENASKLTCLDR